MNIQVRELDNGYTQCADLNRLSSEKGEGLINNLKLDITNLKQHWKGTDATEHINNLIKVRNAMIALVTDAKAVTAGAGNAIIAIQEVRRANGGAGEVGSPLPGNAPDAEVIPNAEATTEYYCVPEAKTDFLLLEQICSDYSVFRNNFNQQKTDLLNNWTAGAGREKAVQVFTDFETNSETYNKYLTEARENLGIAVNNISKLG